jgi:hypothetical protein
MFIILEVVKICGAGLMVTVEITGLPIQVGLFKMVGVNS